VGWIGLVSLTITSRLATSGAHAAHSSYLTIKPLRTVAHVHYTGPILLSVISITSLKLCTRPRATTEQPPWRLMKHSRSPLTGTPCCRLSLRPFGSSVSSAPYKSLSVLISVFSLAPHLGQIAGSLCNHHHPAPDLLRTLLLHDSHCGSSLHSALLKLMVPIARVLELRRLVRLFCHRPQLLDQIPIPQ